MEEKKKVQLSVKKAKEGVKKRKYKKAVWKEKGDAFLKAARKYHLQKREILAPFIARLLIRNRFEEFKEDLETESENDEEAEGATETTKVPPKTGKGSATSVSSNG